MSVSHNNQKKIGGLFMIWLNDYTYCEPTIDENIYFVGDGAGKAGNIVTAAATGLIAARDIVNRNK